MIEILIIIAVYAILTSPTWLEAFLIDPWFWRRKDKDGNPKSDKPASTYLRGVIMVVAAISVDLLVHYSKWYWALGITIAFHILAFAPLINLKLKRPIDYLGGNKYDQLVKQIPLWLRLANAGILLVGAVILFERFKY